MVCGWWKLSPATRALNPFPEWLKPIELWPVFDINLLVSAPLACDEGMIHIVNYVPFPKGNHWRLCLRYILCSHATTDIACFQIDFLSTANPGLKEWQAAAGCLRTLAKCLSARDVCFCHARQHGVTDRLIAFAGPKLVLLGCKLYLNADLHTPVLRSSC